MATPTRQTWTLIIISLVYQYIFLAPLMIFFSARAFSLRSTSLFERRWPQFVFLTCFLFISGVLVSQTVWAAEFFQLIPHTFISRILYLLFIISGLLLLYARCWLIYFHIKLAVEKSEKWREMVDTSKATDEQSFFEKHQATLGTERYTFGIAFVTWFILSALDIVLAVPLKQVELASYVAGAILFVGCTFITVLIFLTPKFTDVFRVRDELKYLVISLIAGIAFFIITAFFGLHQTLIVDYLVHLVTCTLLTVFVLIMTAFPVYTFGQHFSTADSIHIYMRDSTVVDQGNPVGSATPSLDERFINTMSSVDSVTPPTGSNRIDDMRIGLCSESNVNDFMTHLLREFSSEGLLFLIEISAFKLRLINNTNLTEETVESEIPLIGLIEEDENGVKKMIPEMPQSTIVSNSQMSYTEKAKELYFKYVAFHGKYEINVDGESRRKLQGHFEFSHDYTKLSDHELYHLFDECITQILQQASESYVRFCQNRPAAISMSKNMSVHASTSKLV